MIRERGGIWTEVEPSRALCDLPSGRLIVSLDTPIRLAEAGASDDVLTSWFRVALLRVESPPGWPEIRSRLRWNLDPAGSEAAPLVTADVSPQLQRTLVEIDEEESRIRYVTVSERREWCASDTEVRDAANAGLSRALGASPVQTHELQPGERIAWFDTVVVSKAALLLAPDLKNALAGHLEWPILAIAPARDYVLMFSESVGASIVPKLAGLVTRELSGVYPLTSEVLRLGDDGLRAIGAYGSPDR